MAVLSPGLRRRAELARLRPGVAFFSDTRCALSSSLGSASHRAYVIDDGRIVHASSAADLENNAELAV